MKLKTHEMIFLCEIGSLSKLRVKLSTESFLYSANAKLQNLSMAAQFHPCMISHNRRLV